MNEQIAANLRRLDDCRTHQHQCLRDQQEKLDARMKWLREQNPMTPAHQEEHDECQEQHAAIDEEITKYDAAYLAYVKGAVHLDEVIANLDNISKEMDEEAERMKNITKLLATGGALLSLTDSAITVFNRPPSG